MKPREVKSLQKFLFQIKNKKYVNMPWRNDVQRKYKGMYSIWYFKHQFYFTAYTKTAFLFHNIIKNKKEDA